MSKIRPRFSISIQYSPAAGVDRDWNVVCIRFVDICQHATGVLQVFYRCSTETALPNHIYIEWALLYEIPWALIFVTSSEAREQNHEKRQVDALFMCLSDIRVFTWRQSSANERQERLCRIHGHLLCIWRYDVTRVRHYQASWQRTTWKICPFSIFSISWNGILIHLLSTYNIRGNVVRWIFNNILSFDGLVRRVLKIELIWVLDFAKLNL